MKPQVQADELSHEIIDVDRGDMGRLVWHTIYHHEIHTNWGPLPTFHQRWFKGLSPPFFAILHLSVSHVRISVPGGGYCAVLPYTSHIGMCRPKGFDYLRRFGLKTGLDFAHFGLESGMVYEGLRLCINVFVVSIRNGF